MSNRRARGWALLATLAALGISGPADALSASGARSEAQLDVQAVERDLPTVKQAVGRAIGVQTTVAQRIVAGEILLRQGDYDKAIHIFSQVVELHRRGKVDEAAYAEALFSLGESYFKDGQYLSAKRHFEEILDKASGSAHSSYSGRALGRLVDVALRTGYLDIIDTAFAKMSSLPSSDVTGATQYARGKAMYAKGQLVDSKNALGTVPAGSDWHHQAQYLLGVVMVKAAAPIPPPAPVAADPADPDATVGPPATAPEPTSAEQKQRYAAAIEQFRRVTRLAPDTDAHRHVIDLAWMAMGRLFYETDNYLDGAEAYTHVDRKSPEFSTMLYELAWVYVRLGDYMRAQRSLEVLTLTDPKSVHFADGSLLRADLMLRSGQYKQALALYRSVRSQFDPIRLQVQNFLNSTNDPAVYYDRLVQEPFATQVDTQLPPLAIEWAREESEDDRTFAVIDDVSRSRRLIRESRRLIQKLNAVLGSSTRSKAFPKIRAGLEQAVSLLNKLALSRLKLAKGLDAENSSALSGEIGDVRARRRALMRRLSFVPVTEADFARRESAGDQQWNKVSQDLHNTTLEVNRLQAIVNGLKRVMQDADKYGVAKDPASRARFQAEIEANERDIGVYRARIEQYRHAVELGRVQIGFGDQRYSDDDKIRREFRILLNREVQLAVAGHAGSGSASYARSIQPILQRADRAEAQLEALKAELEARIKASTQELLVQISAEAQKIDEHSNQLDDLDQTARLLVGQMAMKNFGLVRDRLKSIVLRADVGIVQQAWEVREERLTRVRGLQREKAREQQNLDDELREVLDDAGEEQ